MPSSIEVDVLVLGSGSAALSASLRAAKSGLRVAILEKAELLGGTSAMSGAGIWIPANHVARAAGIEDSVSEAITYLREASPVGWDAKEDEHWRSFAQNAPRALEFIEKNSPLEFELAPEPDPMAHLPGGRKLGRMVSPRIVSRNILGRLQKKVRRSTQPHWMTYKELVGNDPYHRPLSFGLKHLPQLIYRTLTRGVGQGSAMMTGLIKACLDAGCHFHIGTNAKHLLLDDGGSRVVGVEAQSKDGVRQIFARCGVIIATGGFEWNKEMREKYFPGPFDRLGSPSTNEGDGQLMAAAIGAKLDRMDQANIYPSLPTRYEGRRHGLPMTFQAEPFSILVNRHGKRFVSETSFNVGEAIDRRDPKTDDPVHLPCWLIGDHRFLKRSLPFLWYARHDREWIVKASTIEELAKKIGLPADELKRTVDRYNGFCDAGVDEDFHRGETPFETYKTHGPNNRLGKVERGPFVAMSFNRSILGTKGGARTNPHGQVLREDGTIIAGLYAAGLAMANPIGTRAVGAGTTLGPNLTWGFICAETILRQNSRESASVAEQMDSRC